VNFRWRLVRNIAIGLAGLIAVVLIAAFFVAQTGWFRNYVRSTIISSLQESTGGHVEIGSFDFEVRSLHAEARNFVIHGREPATARPFVAIQQIQLDLRLFSSLTRLYRISFLGVERPEVHIMMLPDGRTNIPEPAHPGATETSPLETVVDLAVSRFSLDHGLLAFASAEQPVDIRGNNLRARLSYNALKQDYEGRLGLEPLYVLNGRNTPVNFSLTLPVVIAKDRVDLRSGSISTPLSTLSIDASIENMKAPRLTTRLKGTLSVWDIANAGNIPLDLHGANALSDVSLDASASGDERTIQVTSLTASIGTSRLEASGALKDTQGNGSLKLHAGLALGELSRLVRTGFKPVGTAILDGEAKLDTGNQYNIAGNIDAKKLSIIQGTERISGIDLTSGFQLSRDLLAMKGIRLRALGGEFTGDASLAEFARYQVDGRLRDLNLQQVLRAAGQRLPYAGTISGSMEAKGDTRISGTRGIAASARLTIAAGRDGIPVSGRLNAQYNGAADDAILDDSVITLPRTRVTLAGALGKRLNVALTSRDLRDLFAAVSPQSPPPVVLNGGEADFNGSVDGHLRSPHIAGHLAVNQFAIEGRAFNSLAADVNVSASGLAVSNALIARDMMRMQMNGSIGLRNWSPVPDSPVSVNAALSNGDLADLIVMAGMQSTGYSGALSVSAQINGTYGNPSGTATVDAARGTIADTPFDHVRFEANLTDQLVALPTAYVDAPAGRISLSAEFHHPRDSITAGQVHAHILSGELNLARIPATANLPPGSGTASFDGDVNGTLAQAPKSNAPTFVLSSVNANASGHGVVFRGISYGDLTATARTSGQEVSYTATSNFAGSNIRATGTTQLTGDHHTTADVNLASLPIERVLAATGEKVPARGQLSGSIHFNGTPAAPEGNADVSLARAVIYGENIDQAHARINLSANAIDVSEFQITTGPAHITMTARYDHPTNDLKNGRARFTIASERVDLARIRNIQQFRSGLGGALDINGNGTAEIRASDIPVQLTSLNANVSATGLTVQGKSYGDLKLTATTSGENRVNFALDSNVAGSNIQARGNALLGADYPVDAQLNFSNVTWTRVSELIGYDTSSLPAFEAVTDGRVSVKGPALKRDQLTASVGLTRLNFSAFPRPGAGKPITLANQATIEIGLERGLIRIQNAHLTGPQSDLQASGSMSMTGRNLNLALTGNLDTSALQGFDRDFYSSGKVVMGVSIRGDAVKPSVNGQLSLQNVSFSSTLLPLGISNANGGIVFNGSTARIQNLTAESGGGKITISGNANYVQTLRFSLRANASNVRVRVQQGLTVATTADMRVSGTPDNSGATGTVTVDRVNYSPQSDLGSLLTRSTPPAQAPVTPNSLLDNMKLDIRIRSLPGLVVQTSMAQNLQADADLRLRGTANQPGMTGRVNIQEGKLTFFGNDYVVDSGTISFYNPVRIEPILDVSLETQAKGVSVTVRVTGAIDNLKLSYTSDPPLQFQEIVALLASGTTPTSDPTLLARQPAQPQQNFQQIGESAILGQAVTNPVSNQLQRVFGVTQFKIDPTFTTGSSIPTAQLAVQQRVSDNLTFTYTSRLNDPNSTIIRMEWAFNPQWSAVLMRDQNGIVTVNFFYKKSFR
jgi:translocation and assembly module TamB